MKNIFNVFGPSPIKPLEQHVHKAHTTVKTLLPFFEVALEANWQEASKYHQEIQHFEHEADKLKKDLRLHLPSGLFLPVPRTDILELLTVQDKLANKAKDIAGLVIGRKMLLPAPIKALYLPFLHCCIDASRQACKAINELDELLETGFKGSEVTIVEEMIVKLNDIEHQTDEMLIKIRQAIFDIESELDAVTTIFLYKLVEWTGQLADYAQTIGGRLQILIAR